jgi:hypothetical protein
VAVGGIAPRSAGAHQVLAGARCPAAFWAGAIGQNRQIPLAHQAGRPGTEGGLGLDHYEGRHRLRWHHYVCLVSMAYTFCAEQTRAQKAARVALALGEEAPVGRAN